MRLMNSGAKCLGALFLCFSASFTVVASETLSMQEGTDLAKRSACLACHQVDAKRVGPSFKQIAARYADSSDAMGHLVESIRNGGRGKWGAVPMPAQRHVNEENTKALAQWILSMKP